MSFLAKQPFDVHTLGSVEIEAGLASSFLFPFPRRHLISGLGNQLDLVAVKVDPIGGGNHQQSTLAHGEIRAQCSHSCYLSDVRHGILTSTGECVSSQGRKQTRGKNDAFHVALPIRNHGLHSGSNRPECKPKPTLADILLEQAATLNQVIAFWLLAAIVFFIAFAGAAQVQP